MNITQDQLYEMLVALCQNAGTTNGATYELLRAAIDTIDSSDLAGDSTAEVEVLTENGKPRKSCSCGEGWADEPGHDKDAWKLEGHDTTTNS